MVDATPADRGDAARTESAATVAVLEGVGLCKRYGGMQAVDSLDITLGASEILGVIGPNGAGKSTLFGLLAGSVPPDAGEVRIRGEGVRGEGAHRRIARGLGRTFQIPRPFPAMTVLENVMTAARRQSGERPLANLFLPGKVARQERATLSRARELLDFLSLGKLAHRPARVLSGGQRKLLEIARVLMAEPRMILLDEPAAGVNPALMDFIVERLVDINRTGVAILLIEHDMMLVERLCPRVLVMAGGRRLADGPPAEVMNDARVIDVFLGGEAA